MQRHDWKDADHVCWVDTNKHDEISSKYWSRLVAKDFKRHNDRDFDSATPPVEMLRFVVSIAATGNSRTGRLWSIMANDVSRAYFDATNMRPVFVELCEEDRDPGYDSMCGELMVSMYGTRTAASNRQKCYTDCCAAVDFE